MRSTDHRDPSHSKMTCFLPADMGIMIMVIDVFASKDVKVNTPTTLKGRSQLDAETVVRDRLLLLACAITHHSCVQSIVLEPCSRLIVQNNEAVDPLRWSVDGAASTGDVTDEMIRKEFTSKGSLDVPKHSTF